MSKAIPLYPSNTFAQRAREIVLRELAPFKQCDIAKAMGVSEARVSHIMTGHKGLTLTSLQQLLVAVDVLLEKEFP